MNNSAGAGMRRVRRGDAAVSTRDDNNSVASDKYGKFNAAREKEMALRPGGDSGGPDGDAEQLLLLSEKLRLTEQQTQRSNNSRRGPMMDSDHFGAPLKKKTSSQAAPSSGNSIGSLHRMQMEISAAKVRDKNRLPILQKNKMNMVFNAFGDNRRLFRRVKKVMKCTQNDNEDVEKDADELNLSSEDTNSKRTSTSKVIFVMMLIALVVFNVGRRKGRNMEKEKESLSSLNNQKLSVPKLQVQDNFIMEKLPKNNQTAALDVLFPSYLSSLSNLTEEYRPEETPYFWDVHFSGESIAEAIFSNCHNLVLAAEFGLRQPDYTEDKLAQFILDGSRYVNVELNTKEGILRASNLGLARSHLADVIISPYLHNMASSVFTKQNPARMFTLFRHPVDRALAMYHYLQKASWDPVYSPEVKNMTIVEFAKSRYIENNWMTRFIVGKTKGKLTHSDMLLAKKIVKFKVLVGLYDELETSMARFQRYFGWKDATKTRGDVAKCRSKTITRGDKNVLGHPISIKDGKASSLLHSNNSYAVQEVITGNAACKAIEKHNLFDLELYAFAKRVYALQGEHIFDVVV